MKDQIDMVYEIFRSMVIADDEIKSSDPLFYRTILSDSLESKTTDDKYLLKLAVLSSHREWEKLYRNIHPNLTNCLGVECQQLTDRGQKYFQISWYELDLLRKEIVEGDLEYFKLLEELKTAEELETSSGTWDSLKRLFFAYLDLKRISQAHSCIQEIRTYLGEFDQDVLYAILYARLLSQASEDDNPEVFDLKTIEEVLDFFTKWSEINKLRSYVAHSVYLENWLIVIEKYLLILENNYLQKGTDSPEEREVNKLGRVIAGIFNRSWMTLDPEFVKDSPTQVLDLMKKHDEIILEMAEISFNPTDVYYFTMYFRGNQILLWRKLLNMTFPQKLSFFLDNAIKGIPAKQSNLKICEFTLPDDQISKQFMERLQAEFPENAELIERELSVDASELDEEIRLPGDNERLEEESGEETPPQ